VSSFEGERPRGRLSRASRRAHYKIRAYAKSGFCGGDPRARHRGVGRRQRPDAHNRSLRAREVHRAGDCRPGGADLRPRARARGGGAARRRRRRSRGALRPRRGHAGRSRLRRAAGRLQLDGVSRERRLRRLRHGYHRLRSIVPPGGDERSLQPREGSAGAVREGAVRAELRARLDDDRVGLERHRRRDRLHTRAAARGARQPARMVARWTARRRLRVAASGESAEARAARAGLQPRRRGGAARQTAARRRPNEHAVARGVLRELGSAGRVPGAVRAGRRRRGVARDDRVGSDRRDVEHRRPPRAADGDMGLQRRRRGEDADADDDGGWAARQAGAARSRARVLRGSRRAAEGLRGSRLRVAQCDVGEESVAALPRVARLAHRGRGPRRQGRNVTARLLTRRAAALAAMAAVLALAGAGVFAQQRFRGGFGPRMRNFVPGSNVYYDGRFTFVRVRYETGPGGYWYRGLPAWAPGHPMAEQNLMRIMNEVSFLGAQESINTVTLDDPALFKYPIAYIIEASCWQLNDREAAGLRAD